jgi:hypothetical protein
MSRIKDTTDVNVERTAIGTLKLNFKQGLRTDGEITYLSLTQFIKRLNQTSEQTSKRNSLLARTIRARMGD